MKNYDLIKSEVVWSGTKSKTTHMHAFLSGAAGSAACRKGTKAGSRLIAAEKRSASMLATTYCDKCAEAVASMVNRREASMAPSTGEGDYLAPASF